MCLYTSDFTTKLRTIAAGGSMSTEFPIFILGKNVLTSYGFSRPDNFETELRMNAGLTSDEITSSCGIDHIIRREINFEMNYRALQESVSFLNPFELENSHEGFGRTPLTMHRGAPGTEVNAEGFSRTPLTMHDGASGTEVNAVFMNLEEPIQITPEVLENTSEDVMTGLQASNHSSTENKIPRGVIHSIFNRSTRRK